MGFLNYPRAGVEGWKRFVPQWQAFAALASAGVIVGGGSFLVAYAAVEIPTAEYAPGVNGSVIYYSDGKTKITDISKSKGSDVALANLPPYITDPFVGQEDQTFWKNSGISVRGIAGAALGTIRGNARGGSTITQQYVKNLYTLRQSGDPMSKVELGIAKLKEIVVALKITRQQSKEEIMTGYLNNIYFGQGAFGIENASQVYFAKPAKELTREETMVLACLIPSPNNWNPRSDLELNQTKWKVNRKMMVEAGLLSQADADAMEYPKIAKSEGGTESSTAEGQAGYIRQMVEAEMIGRYGYTRYDLQTKALEITTTFDKDMMAAAVEAVKVLPMDEMTDAQKEAGLVHPALVSIDNSTGAVRAIYGGPDSTKQPFNNAYDGVMQGASTFKMFSLLTALDRGTKSSDGEPLSLKSTYWGGSPREFEGLYDGGLENFDNHYSVEKNEGRMMDLPFMTQKSANTAFFALNMDVRPHYTERTAIKMGIMGPHDPNSVTNNADDLRPGTGGRADIEFLGGLRNEAAIEDNYANVLGTGSPHPIDLASAYSTLAAGGKYQPWFTVASFRDPTNANKGTRLGFDPVQVVDEGAARNAIYSLQQVVATGGTATSAAGNYSVAGKTGTSQSNRSALFAGFTPELTTVVAMWRQKEGSTTQEPLKDVFGKGQITGGSFPAQIWRKYMDVAMQHVGSPRATFPQPDFTRGFVYNEAPPEGIAIDQQPEPQCVPGTVANDLDCDGFFSDREPRDPNDRDPNVPGAEGGDGGVEPECVPGTVANDLDCDGFFSDREPRDPNDRDPNVPSTAPGIEDEPCVWGQDSGDIDCDGVRTDGNGPMDQNDRDPNVGAADAGGDNGNGDGDGGGDGGNATCVPGQDPTNMDCDNFPANVDPDDNNPDIPILGGGRQ